MDVPHCLDTNVLIYAFSGSSKQAAKTRIARDWIDRDDWGVTVQVLQEFYVNALRPRSDLGHDAALAIIEEIASSRPVVPIDLAVVRHALQIKSRYRIGYWDAAVIAGAHRLGASVLVTEDLSHRQVYGSVKVANPFASK